MKIKNTYILLGFDEDRTGKRAIISCGKYSFVVPYLISVNGSISRDTYNIIEIKSYDGIYKVIDGRHV